MREITKEGQLLSFMRGWKRAAAGGAFTDAEMANEDFKSGWDTGREASSNAYKKASRKYKAQLSPLRLEKK